MFRFKQLWVSFWRKDQGLGMIEAAITLPLFLLITFGVIEFGNMFLQRYQTRDVANDVADYLQANPSASSADLQTFVTNLGLGTLKNTGPDQDNSVYTKIRIKSEKTMMTAAQFDAMCAGADKNWANPWVGGDAADDKNPYYIHVCYPYSYKTVTPLPKLMAGGMEETKILKGKAMAYINTTTGSDGGTPVADMSCPSGQMVTGFTGGQPVCGAVPTSGGGSGTCFRGAAGTVLPDGTVYTGIACMTTTPKNIPAPEGIVTWLYAMNYCENLTAHGHSDWFLPTKEELVAISQNKDAIGGFVFPGWEAGVVGTHGGPNTSGYWSSSFTFTWNAYTVYFDNPRESGIGVDWNYQNSYKYRARCIRR
jgi:hypothetical protein